MTPTLNPYLTFNGNAAEAMKFYHSVLGGELNMQTFGEAKMAKTPDEESRIVHAVLKSGGTVFMASDSMIDRPVKIGENVNMSLSGQEADRLPEVFDGLARGGKIDMPLAKQFWGDTFGMLTDKFGIHWMVNIAARQE